MVSTFDARGEITQLLAAARAGDTTAADRLFDSVYAELRRRARGVLAGRGAQTLSATALVHEVYLRLARHGLTGRDRDHFFAVASTAMRQIVIDHARRRQAGKRGSSPLVVSLEVATPAVLPRGEEVLAVDEALRKLEALDSRLGQLVELRFFGGLSLDEAAEVLAVSERTARRDWTKACAFLTRELAQAGR